MATAAPSFKVILCGEYGVGKSSLFRRYVDNSFTTDTGPKSTIGLDHFSKEITINGGKVKISLWDTAGIERFATLSSSYFQSSSAALLCYSSVDRESFNILSQHILDIIMHTQTAKIFLCGNKSDLESDDMITSADVEAFREQCDTVLSETFTVSCKTGDGVAEMFKNIGSVLQRDAAERFDFDPSKIRPHEKLNLPVKKSNCCS